MTETELEPRVGHDKSTVRKALAQLALYNLVAKVMGSRETWHLTDKGFQLPLPLDWTRMNTDFTDISILIRVYPRNPCPNERIGKLRLEWVTPQYVKAMHARWEQEGHTSRETGLLVRYIEDGDPEPIICQECNGADGHYDSCKSLGNVNTLAELVARGVVKGIQRPSPELVQAMMRYNYEKTVMPY